MTGGAPKWRTIKKVFSLPGSDDLEGGIFQSNWYMQFESLAFGHLLLHEVNKTSTLINIQHFL